MVHSKVEVTEPYYAYPRVFLVCCLGTIVGQLHVYCERFFTEQNLAMIADDGRRWQTMADDGRRWQTMADEGRRWQTMADDRRRWETIADGCRRSQTITADCYYNATSLLSDSFDTQMLLFMSTSLLML
jgi:hypothetical protein